MRKDFNDHVVIARLPQRGFPNLRALRVTSWKIRTEAQVPGFYALLRDLLLKHVTVNPAAFQQTSGGSFGELVARRRAPGTRGACAPRAVQGFNARRSSGKSHHDGAFAHFVSIGK
jgi:hypothetical protein